MDDLAIILVSHHGTRWLRPCLNTVLGHLGQIAVDIVVANNADDGTAEIVADEFPRVRLIRCANRGFAHANNRALLTCDARYALFLNVDTEVLEGTFESLVEALDARPSVGVAGVRQQAPDGTVLPTIRRFPSAARAFAESLGSERLPFRASWLGERELRLSFYSEERECDWVSGSFLVARREALESAGLMDERFFLYSEEPDLAYRVKQAGWDVRYLPTMTILHHAGEGRSNPKLAGQDAYSRLQFARKHFSRTHRAAYAAALGLGYALRAAAPGRGRVGRRAARSALRVLSGLDAPPFGAPPPQAMAPLGSLEC